MKHNLKEGDKIIVVPTSCRCGGDKAFMLESSDRQVMLGCVCHTKLSLETSTFASAREEPDRNKDVHTEHCCYNCGCKYGDEFCSVTTGRKGQSYECGRAWCGEC